MTIRLQKKESNLAHSDYMIFIDEILSGVVRLWNEEIDSFMLFIELWNARQINSSRGIAMDKGNLPLEIGTINPTA